MNKKKGVVQYLGQNREEYGMRMAEVTAEKFDPTYEVEMLAMCSQREALLGRLREIESQYLGKSQVFPIIELIQTLLALRTASLDVIESVIRWRGRLVNREPVMYREKDGTYVNYLLKLLRDTERHLRTFDLPRQMGVTFNQRNPMLLPLFPHHFEGKGIGGYPSKLVTVNNSIRHDLLLEHIRSAIGYSHSLVPTDVPRLWWSSNVEFRKKIYGLLKKLCDLGGDPVLLARVAEGHQYLKQEEMSSNRKSHHHKASQKTSHISSPYLDDEEATDSWGFDDWVKMPWSPGYDPDPQSSLEATAAVTTANETESEVEAEGDVRASVLLSRKERAAAVALAAEQARKTKPTVDESARRTLEERWAGGLGNRGEAIPTTYLAKTACSPKPPNPWWGADAPQMDDHLFAASHARSTEERKFAPTVRPDALDGEGGEPIELGKALAFPPIKRPAGINPPPIAAAQHITLHKRTDDFSILNEAAELAQEAAAVVDAAAAEAAAEAAALNLLMKPSEPREERKSLLSVAREALGTPTSPKKELSLFEKKKVKERLRARKRDTIRVEQERSEREARFKAERKRAMKQCFQQTIKHSVEDQHDDLLRILSHCEEVAPITVTASSQISPPPHRTKKKSTASRPSSMQSPKQQLPIIAK